MKLAAAVALLGMLALAAAVDVETQKQKYDGDKPEYKEGYVHDHHHHANVHASHKHWHLKEKVGQTHPCAELYEILGSTVSQSAELTNEEHEKVGSVFWSGIVTHQDECGHCKDHVDVGHHVVRVNYEVIFEFTAKHPGQLITKISGDSIFSTATTTLAVLGGTGAYEGAWGTVTWYYGPNDTSKYVFDIQLPKVHDYDSYGKDYKEGEYKEDYDYKQYKDSEEYRY